MVSLKSRSSVEFKIKKILFLSFLFSRSYRGSKICVNTGYLFTFSVIFLQIKIFSIKMVFQTQIFCQKMNRFCDPNRLKATKKTSSCRIGSFNMKKKFEIYLRALFYKIFFFAFLGHLETSHFSYRGSVND